MNGRKDGAVWKRQPLARLTRFTARPSQSARSSSSSLRNVSLAISSSSTRFRSASDSGSWEASSAASMMRFASAGFGMDPHVNGREALRLGDVDQRLASELQQREEGDHQHRDSARRIEQLGELQHAALLEP